MKDVVWLRKATVRCLTTFDPWISEWGNPTIRSFRKESERRELKNLSTCRKRNRRDSLSSASEKGIAQTFGE